MAQSGFVLAVATMNGVAQTKPAVPQITPAAVLMHIDEKAGEVFYHDRNDKLVHLQFLVNNKTVRPPLTSSALVVVTYVDEGTTHIAQKVQLFSAQNRFSLPHTSSGIVGGVATNTLRTTPSSGDVAVGSQQAATKATAVYEEPTTYSQEGAIAMKSALEAFLKRGKSRDVSYSVKVRVKQSGITFAALADNDCTAINVMDTGEIQTGCATESGTLTTVDWTGTPAPVRAKRGSVAYLDDITIEPGGLGVGMSLANAKSGRYISTVWIPFDRGELPARAELQQRLREIVDISSGTGGYAKSTGDDATRAKKGREGTPPANAVRPPATKSSTRN
jgi:hypothetical protein